MDLLWFSMTRSAPKASTVAEVGGEQERAAPPVACDGHAVGAVKDEKRRLLFASVSQTILTDT